MGKNTQVSSWSERRIRAAGRRTEIIEAVLRLVDEYGVSGTTTARIASEVGVTEPTLYTYFENRQDMLVSALDVLFDRVEDLIRLKPGIDPVQQLRDLGRGHTDEVMGRRIGFVSRSFEFIVSPAETGLRAHVRERSLGIIEVLREIVDEGKRQGRIRPEVDSRRVAWRIVSFYWMEDMAGLLDLTDVVREGISTDYLNSIIDEISLGAGISPGA
jgi:TetR/AcrR family fatty acid metabolism transcriptional regulator